jgi:hypothetical protein
MEVHQFDAGIRSFGAWIAHGSANPSVQAAA